MPQAFLPNPLGPLDLPYPPSEKTLLKDSFKILYFSTDQYLPGLRPTVFLNGYFAPMSTTIAKGTYRKYYYRHTMKCMKMKHHLHVPCKQFANALSKAAYPRAGGLHYAIYLGVLFHIPTPRKSFKNLFGRGAFL